MKVLVTGATGWVGSRLVLRLLAKGFFVGGTRGGSSPSHEGALKSDESSRVDWRSLDLTNALSVENAISGDWDAVIHLAGISTHSEAEADPGHAWNVNAAGTARLCHALAAKRNGRRPRVIVVSSGDIYGEGAGRPNVETDLPAPRSTYAATKRGAELAARGIAVSRGLQVIIARPWPHTGPGQKALLFPRWIAALKAARAAGMTAELKGDPETVRDYLTLDDVVDAYLALLERGIPGETYNISSGRAMTFREAATMLAAKIGSQFTLTPDPSRASGARYSVGSFAKLKEATGWSPTRPLEATLAEMIDAETH
jgi:GDP-4-dehydro-6-deoxy-D-mannose reductase